MREGLLGASYLYTMTDRLPFPTVEQVVAFCHENRGMALHSLRLKAGKDPLAPCLIDQVQVRREMSERFGPLIKCPGYLFPLQESIEPSEFLCYSHLESGRTLQNPAEGPANLGRYRRKRCGYVGIRNGGRPNPGHGTGPLLSGLTSPQRLHSWEPTASS